MSYLPAKKKHRWVGPVVLLAVLIALVLAAFFVLEKLARDAAGGVVATPIQKALGATSKVQVDLGPGLFLPQAVSGSLDEVRITTAGLPVGEGTAELDLLAIGLPLDMGGTATSLHATVSLDATALASVLQNGGTVQFTADGFIVSSETDIGGTPTPVALTVTPAAGEGAVTLDVTAITINGEQIEVEAARSGAYGPAAAALADPAPICVAQYLPEALKLQTATVNGNGLVLSLQGASVRVGSLSTKGSCASPEAEASAE
jgi:hypothetical protein